MSWPAGRGPPAASRGAGPGLPPRAAPAPAIAIAGPIAIATGAMAATVTVTGAVHAVRRVPEPPLRPDGPIRIELAVPATGPDHHPSTPDVRPTDEISHGE